MKLPQNAEEHHYRALIVLLNLGTVAMRYIHLCLLAYDGGTVDPLEERLHSQWKGTMKVPKMSKKKRVMAASDVRKAVCWTGSGE